MSLYKPLDKHPSPSSRQVNTDTIVMEFLIHVHNTLPHKIDLPSFLEVSTEVVHSALHGSERPPSVLVEKGYLKATVSDVRHCTPMENVIRHEVGVISLSLTHSPYFFLYLSLSLSFYISLTLSPLLITVPF